MRRTKWFAAMLVGLAFACGEGTVERPAGRVTALEQSNDSADLEVTKNIRQALIDRFGPPGKKKAPGATYGLSGDMWSALAVAVTFTDKLGGAA